LAALAAAAAAKGQTLTLAVDAATVLMACMTRDEAIALQQKRQPPVSATQVRSKLSSWADSLDLEKHGVKVILVLDGKNCLAKEQIKRAERERRTELAEAAMDDIRSAPHTSHSAGRFWKEMAKTVSIDADIVANVLAWCSTRDWATTISAWSEADAQVCSLVMDGIADAIVTSDSDIAFYPGRPMVLFGAHRTMPGLVCHPPCTSVAPRGTRGCRATASGT